MSTPHYTRSTPRTPQAKTFQEQVPRRGACEEDPRLIHHLKTKRVVGMLMGMVRGKAALISLTCALA
jgi:hypothetical protein